VLAPIIFAAGVGAEIAAPVNPVSNLRFMPNVPVLFDLEWSGELAQWCVHADMRGALAAHVLIEVPDIFVEVFRKHFPVLFDEVFDYLFLALDKIVSRFGFAGADPGVEARRSVHH
jgi:hypothetical protein